MRTIALFLLKIYQKLLTLFIGYGSCRYYPSCSEYARQSFIFNNFIKALYLSSFRILRCNQLFEGYFDYPTTKLKIEKIKYFNNSKKIKYWFVPIRDSDRFYIVKNIIFKKVI